MRTEADQLEGFLIRMAEIAAPNPLCSREEALRYLGTVRVLRRGWDNSQPCETAAVPPHFR